MDEIFVLSLLIEEYKLNNNCTSLPESFDFLRENEKIEVLKKALDENKKIEEIINEKN